MCLALLPNMGFVATIQLCRSSHGKHVNEWTWLCSNKTLLMDSEFRISLSLSRVTNYYCFDFFLTIEKYNKPFLACRPYGNRWWPRLGNVKWATACQLLEQKVAAVSMWGYTLARVVKDASPRKGLCAESSRRQAVTLCFSPTPQKMEVQVQRPGSVNGEREGNRGAERGLGPQKPGHMGPQTRWGLQSNVRASHWALPLTSFMTLGKWMNFSVSHFLTKWE